VLLLAESTKRNVWPLIALIALGLLLFFGLGSAKLPLVLSFCFAYLLFPLIQKLESYKIPRQYSVIGSFFILCGILAGFLMLLLPPLLLEARTLLESLPQLFEQALGRLEALLFSWGFTLPLDQASLLHYFRERLSQLDSQLFTQSTDLLRGFAGRILDSFLALMNLFLIPVFFFFLILDWERLVNTTKDLIPPSFRQQAHSSLANIDRILSGFIRGQLVVAFILAGLYSLALTLVSLPFAIVVGTLTGLLSFIPYVGFSLGLLASIAICLSDFGWTQLALVLFALFSVQAIESFVLTPKIVGDKVGLNSLEALIFMIVGGNLFGFFGILLAIPTGAILKVLMKELLRRYRTSPIFSA
jgi:predicted PurR-regulated permease PerM